MITSTRKCIYLTKNDISTKEHFINKLRILKHEVTDSIDLWKYNIKRYTTGKEENTNNACISQDKKDTLTVAFVVTQNNENTTAGDYFTALTLANNLKEFGWNIKYLAQYPTIDQKNWYYIDDDVDVIISLLDRYNLNKIRSNNKSLLKIAWIRNWFELWVELPYFNQYDIILSSSNKSCEFIKEKTGKEAILYPLATDPLMFNENIPPKEEYMCDYCFTGSYWGIKREIIDCLNPSSLDYNFNLYGTNWEKVPQLKDYFKGFVNYEDMPSVYSSTKIVIDDANHVTRKYGSVNSRIFDSIASGKLVITNGSIGNTELFNNEIPEYHSEQELSNQLKFYLENPEKREAKIKRLQRIIKDKHTYEKRAKTLKHIIEDYYKNHAK